MPEWNEPLDNRGTPVACRRCFEQECGRCFSKAFGPVPMEPSGGLIRGHDITPDLRVQCKDNRASKSKKQVMGRFFGQLLEPHPPKQESGWDEDPLSL